jgi:hypothetical protein
MLRRHLTSPAASHYSLILAFIFPRRYAITQRADKNQLRENKNAVQYERNIRKGGFNVLIGNHHVVFLASLLFEKRGWQTQFNGNTAPRPIKTNKRKRLSKPTKTRQHAHSHFPSSSSSINHRSVIHPFPSRSRARTGMA